MVEKEQIKKILSDMEESDKWNGKISEIDTILSNIDNMSYLSLILELGFRVRTNDYKTERRISLPRNLSMMILSALKEEYMSKLKMYQNRLEGLSVINTNGF